MIAMIVMMMMIIKNITMIPMMMIIIIAMSFLFLSWSSLYNYSRLAYM